MTSSSSSPALNEGMGFISYLTLLFIALKLCGVIDWSWLWVLSPLWITFSVIAVISIAAGLIANLKDR